MNPDSNRMTPKVRPCDESMILSTSDSSASISQPCDESRLHRRIEESFFDILGARENAATQVIFILGAPRTGSTWFYQLALQRWHLPYIDNLTNERLWRTPLLGIFHQHLDRPPLVFESAYGKINGAGQPSEASNTMQWWFGGGHPSQLESTTVIFEREPHMLRTLDAINRLSGRALLVKNAWNCFRVPYLASRLTQALFLWIRRDIRDAAASDLQARYRTKGNANSWNSATPANVAQLVRLHPARQVIENQYEFHRAIDSGLRAHACGRYATLWYEDLLQEPVNVFEQLEAQLPRLQVADSGMLPADAIHRNATNAALDPADGGVIEAHLKQHGKRFLECRHASLR